MQFASDTERVAEEILVLFSLTVKKNVNSNTKTIEGFERIVEQLKHIFDFLRFLSILMHNIHSLVLIYTVN